MAENKGKRPPKDFDPEAPLTTENSHQFSVQSSIFTQVTGMSEEQFLELMQKHGMALPEGKQPDIDYALAQFDKMDGAAAQQLLSQFGLELEAGSANEKKLKAQFRAAMKRRQELKITTVTQKPRGPGM